MALNNQYGIFVAVGCNGVLGLADSIAGIMICRIWWATDTLEERFSGTDSEELSSIRGKFSIISNEGKES